MITARDRDTIRALASKWMELSSMPVMNERKRLWKAVHDLKAERPVIMIETSTIEKFVLPSDLRCEDPFLRAVERLMLDNVRHAEEVGDDIVIEPYFRISWQLDFSDFGVPVELKPGLTAQNEKSLGYTFNFPIKKPEDINKLKKRTVRVDKEKTMRHRALLENVMGDILPVKVANYDPFMVDPGNEEWAGMFFFDVLHG